MHLDYIHTFFSDHGTSHTIILMCCIWSFRMTIQLFLSIFLFLFHNSCRHFYCHLCGMYTAVSVPCLQWKKHFILKLFSSNSKSFIGHSIVLNSWENFIRFWVLKCIYVGVWLSTWLALGCAWLKSRPGHKLSRWSCSHEDYVFHGVMLHCLVAMYQHFGGTSNLTFTVEGWHHMPQGSKSS